MQCSFTLLGICFSRPPGSTSSFFGFSEFLTALALLALAFSVSDFRYRFRLWIAPANLRLLFYFGTIAIGFGTIATTLWFSLLIPAPALGVPRVIIEAALASGFLFFIFAWLWYGYIRPARFGKYNHARFAHIVKISVVRKNRHHDLAEEILHSIAEIVRHAKITNTDDHSSDPKVQASAELILLSMGYPDFCRTLAREDPTLAIALLEEMKRQKIFDLPVIQFLRNFTAEAILSKDSFLHSEHLGYQSGLLGYQQPFTSLLFKDPDFLSIGRGLGDHPLDLNFRLFDKLDQEQFTLYCHLVEAALETLIESDRLHTDTWLNRALENLLKPFYEAGDLRDTTSGRSEAYWKIWEAMRVLQHAINVMGKSGRCNALNVPSRARKKWSDSLVDRIADTLFQACLRSVVPGLDHWVAWDLQHNTVWNVLSYDESKVANKVRRRVSRLLFDQILQMENFANFQSARALGFCLHVFGLGNLDKKDFPPADHPIRRASQRWAATHYASLWHNRRSVAEAVLTGSLSYDPDSHCLIKEYSKGTLDTAPQRKLWCCPISASNLDFDDG
jgi:hypothetical protein